MSDIDNPNNIIYLFPTHKKSVNKAILHGGIVADNWQPDIIDYNCFDDDKASFIHAEAAAYLETTIKISDTLDDRIFKVLGLIVAALSATIGFMLLKCNFTDFVCKADENNILWPATILLIGLFTSGFVLATGAFRHQPYALPGNQPQNMIRNDFCGLSVALMKISTAIGMEERINNNLTNLDRTSNRLQVGVKIALISLLIAACVAMITANASSLQKHQTPLSLPSVGSVPAR